MLKLAFIVFLTIHWVSCMFFVIGASELSGLDTFNLEEGEAPVSWIQKNFDLTDGAEPIEPWEFYTTTMYYSLLTMATIGYGDIAPITETEMIFIIFVLLIACALFAFILGYINSFIDKDDTLIEELK
jgi:hypothetical protein